MPKVTKEAKKVQEKAPSAKKESKKKTTTKTATSTKQAVSSNTKKTVTTKTKKAASSKTTKTTKATKATKTTKKIVKPEIVEYYDLPYRYNQTIVKVLAQTPTSLFIYWDISDEDREQYIKDYGENFFNITKPVLIIHNKTLNYSFEVEINDFANSWYLHVNDSKCDYHIELGRRPIEYTKKIQSDYIYISSSNSIETPNDRILFNTDENMVYFRNTKTNIKTSKSISHLSFMRNMGKLYKIYDLYQAIYQKNNIEELNHLSNPSSNSNH